MSEVRLIDAEALKEKLNKKAFDLANGGMIFIESINHIIDNAPTVENPQSDLISREDLKKSLHNFFDGKIIDEPAYILRDVFCYIDNAPTVEAVEFEYHSKLLKQAYQKGKDIRPQGEWIKGNAYYDERAKSMFDKCKCSICGVTQSFYEDDETGNIYSFNFCPNCGADMRGKEE